jgi:hypothetical protein
MKKVLLSTAALAAMISVSSAESFNGFFLGSKGGVSLWNASGKTLGAKAKADGAYIFDVEGIDATGFGFNGFSALVNAGYSFRMQGGFVIGAEVGAGYLSNGLTVDRVDKKATDIKKDDLVLGSKFDISGFGLEARVRIGYAFNRMHIFLDPGLATVFGAPKFELKTPNAADVTKTDVISAEAADASFIAKSAFVVGLNAHYAVTQNVFFGGGVGIRMSFANFENLNGEDQAKMDKMASTVGTTADKAKDFVSGPLSLEANLAVGMSF